MISEKSVEEFIRILLPEAINSDIEGEVIVSDGTLEVKVKIDGKESSIKERDLENLIEDQKMIMLKSALLKAYDKKYPWGSLIGVRPTKMVRRILALGFTKEEVRGLLKNIYLAKDEKIDLLLEIIEREKKLLNKEAVNMYIGIPFCPSKCSYCSFASYEIGSPVGERFYKDFVDTLLEEIEIMGEFSRKQQLKIESLYIGGGTPSTLELDDLEKILRKIYASIDSQYLKEFTFEAGREDSLDKEKLALLRRYGIDRISLNPQTFNQKTLDRLNRKFNREHFDEIYEIIKSYGLTINMDIIVGLPGESVEDISYTLKELEKYDIENFTVHILAKKKGSVLYKESEFKNSEIDSEQIEKEIGEFVKKKGLKPYYMYRQKNSLEWGENVGYSIPTYESRFNIEMIEENQETLGLGGGAITKIIKPETDMIDQVIRVVNPKDPALYIKEMRERCEKKIELFLKK